MKSHNSCQINYQQSPSDDLMKWLRYGITTYKLSIFEGLLNKYKGELTAENIEELRIF